MLMKLKRKKRTSDVLTPYFSVDNTNGLNLWNITFFSRFIFAADVSPCAGQQAHQAKWYVAALTVVFHCCWLSLWLRERHSLPQQVSQVCRSQCFMLENYYHTVTASYVSPSSPAPLTQPYRNHLSSLPPLLFLNFLLPTASPPA